MEFKPLGIGLSGIMDGSRRAPFICSIDISSNYIQGSFLDPKGRAWFLYSGYLKLNMLFQDPLRWGFGKWATEQQGAKTQIKGAWSVGM